uniref:Uncharacterized protein n=1 Tax=Tanacetum cinerariifolium TaxID=118510 RepID=A0A6L2JSD1_TANCI|nr:hypothetical protein [Tanacetum cinerariifolium]
MLHLPSSMYLYMFVTFGLGLGKTIGFQVRHNKNIDDSYAIKNIVNIYKNLDSTFSASLVSSDVGHGTSHCPALCKTKVKDKKVNVEMVQECNFSNGETGADGVRFIHLEQLSPRFSSDSKKDSHSSDPSSRHRRPVDKDVYGTKLESKGTGRLVRYAQGKEVKGDVAKFSKVTYVHEKCLACNLRSETRSLILDLSGKFVMSGSTYALAVVPWETNDESLVRKSS